MPRSGRGWTHLYRALDFLDEHSWTVEEALFMRSRDLFSLEVDLVLFDTTSTESVQ